jgi:hypothetical protein
MAKYLSLEPLDDGACERQERFLAQPVCAPKAISNLDDQIYKQADDQKDGQTVADDFHASNDRYCIFATIRNLDSPHGFQCMVEGCGQAD